MQDEWVWSAADHETLLLTLAVAESQQQLLDQLVEGSAKALKGVTLWRREEGTLAFQGWSGTEDREGRPVPLYGAPNYLLGWTPEAPLPVSVQAMLGLRLLYLNALHEKRQLNDRLSVLHHAALTDPLTGLDNRRAFDTDLEAAEVAQEDYVVIIIDLNGFKALNDKFGHALGDSLLRGYGVWLSRVTHGRAQVYRLGGDEFVVLMRHVSQSPEAFSVWAMERLQVPFVDGVSAAIGIAWRHECDEMRAVLGLADQRMYAVKKAALSSSERSRPPG
ncbi:GGDEF domain-containing protein (plasmid) [Deinococcus sp. KNUC1210]|uniref:GGDEF domain-containing protein n=1 Tax=Deinococcus sp. KNUC1210 TaxID=2917691 RepID=UPI001EF15817|nr:GGDEF domain-containing protein [Deinococcus sp. KNUC1210]ULH18347.1 GGDEF domain-containing protein [Deinococcus sp. KNUC1210]